MINCLTYNQLQAYSENTLNKAERGHLYMHISSCELCACAVNGFSAVAFSSDELVAIHREIDAKVNAKAANPLTIAQVLIVIISLASIAGVYTFSNRSSEPHTITKNLNTKSTLSIPVKYETKTASEKEISSLKKTFKKVVKAIEYQKFERNITPIEQLKPIKQDAVYAELIAAANDENACIIPPCNADVIYIYDLKITNYNKLYFGHAAAESNLFKTHTPVFKENRESVADDFGIERHIIPADRVLKDGLMCFNKQQYHSALENFNLLIGNNPNDVNAKFYAALSYYNLNKMDKSIRNLKDVLQNTNNGFYPEAQWYLALVTLKSGDRQTAKQQLETIVSEKGFYAKKAKAKLKSL